MLQALDPAGASAAFLPGMTRSGKRKRRHPTAEMKGGWTPKEDELLIKYSPAAHAVHAVHATHAQP